MQKLFSLSFRRIASRLNQTELNALNVSQALQNSQIASSGQPFLYRLPRDQLKHILNISCPINNLQEPNTPAIVAAAKALRHHAKIKEEKICSKCPFKQNCVSAKQQFTGTIDNAPKDLLIFCSGLSNLAKPEQVFYRHWVSAYKLGDNIIAALDDLSQGGKEIEQFQKLRLQMLKLNEQNHRPTEASQPAKEAANNQQPKESKKAKKNAKKAHQQGNLAANQVMKNTGLQPNTQQQILGRDFSFDEVEEFEAQTKFSKDTFKQKKQSKQTKNNQSKAEKGYKFIERNENTNFQKNKKAQNKQKRLKQFQQEQDYDDMPRSKGKKYRSKQEYQSDKKKPIYDNRRNDYNSNKRYRYEQNYQRQPRQENYRKYNKNDNRRYEEDEQNFRQRGNNYRGGDRRDNYQNRNYDQRQNQRDNQRQYNERRPNRNYQQNQDSKFSKKYQKEDYQPQRSQRQQKKGNKPNPFINKWSQSQDFDDVDFKQSPKKQFQRKQTKEQPAKPTVKIIETETIEDRNQAEGRAGRNVRRRGRSTSNPNIQTTTQ